MKTNFPARLLPAALALLLSGCATVDSSKYFSGVRADGQKEPRATIAVENYGYYLFRSESLPIWCGNPELPNYNSSALFEDTVSTQNNLKMLSDAAVASGARSLTNVKHEISWTGSFFPWIVWRKVAQTTAVAVE